MLRPLIHCFISLLICHRVSSLIATPPSVYCNHYRSTSRTTSYNQLLLEYRNRRRLASQRRGYISLQSAHDKISNSHVIIDLSESDTRIEEVSATHQLSDDNTQSSDNTQTSNTNIIDKQLLTDLPKHIAFICDGNSRWAQSKSLHESLGHVAGADRVVNLIKTLQHLRIDDDNADDADAHDESTTLQSNIDIEEEDRRTAKQQQRQTRIEYCTLFAFSTENWSRSQLEITALFKLITQTALQYTKHSSILNGTIQISLVGNIYDNRIPKDMRSALLDLVKISTDACDERRRRRQLLEEEDDILTICLAINYGGRADILQAAASLAQSIASGEVTLTTDSNNDDDTLQQQLDNESLISSRLSTSTIPDPDLIIRTGGEQRLSNFLLWNLAYTELYFSEVLWPDFDNDELIKALRWYGLRNRRFGGR